MVTVQVELDEVSNEYIGVYKAKNKLGSKAKAILLIVKEHMWNLSKKGGVGKS